MIVKIVLSKIQFNKNIIKIVIYQLESCPRKVWWWKMVERACSHCGYYVIKEGEAAGERMGKIVNVFGLSICKFAEPEESSVLGSFDSRSRCLCINIQRHKENNENNENIPLCLLLSYTTNDNMLWNLNCIFKHGIFAFVMMMLTTTVILSAWFIIFCEALALCILLLFFLLCLLGRYFHLILLGRR